MRLSVRNEDEADAELALFLRDPEVYQAPHVAKQEARTRNAGITAANVKSLLASSINARRSRPSRTLRVVAEPLQLWTAGPVLASIDIEPVLASWDRHDHPSQRRLRVYLDEVERALRPAAGAPTGPLCLDMEVRLPTGRNWINLWKPSGDALGPILGVADPRRRFSPNDDRIVELDLHLTTVTGGSDDIDLGVWWRPTP
jgi:hypothetical protein